MQEYEDLVQDSQTAWSHAHATSMAAGFEFRDITTGQMITPPDAHVGIVDSVVAAFSEGCESGRFVCPQTELA